MEYRIIVNIIPYQNRIDRILYIKPNECMASYVDCIGQLMSMFDKLRKCDKVKKTFLVYRMILKQNNDDLFQPVKSYPWLFYVALL